MEDMETMQEVNLTDEVRADEMLEKCKSESQRLCAGGLNRAAVQYGRGRYHS